MPPRFQDMAIRSRRVPREIRPATEAPALDGGLECEGASDVRNERYSYTVHSYIGLIHPFMLWYQLHMRLTSFFLHIYIHGVRLYQYLQCRTEPLGKNNGCTKKRASPFLDFFLSSGRIQITKIFADLGPELLWARHHPHRVRRRKQESLLLL